MFKNKFCEGYSEDVFPEDHSRCHTHKSCLPFRIVHANLGQCSAAAVQQEEFRERCDGNNLKVELEQAIVTIQMKTFGRPESAEFLVTVLPHPLR